MKKFLMLLHFNLTFIITVLPQAGSLDPVFGNNGYVSSETFNYWINGYSSVAVQNDGKIVVAKHIGTSTLTVDFAINRYNTDGSLDNDFGVDGLVITDFSNWSDVPFGIAIQSDGKIIVVGSSFSTDYKYSLLMCRYNIDGSLDASFGSGGLVTTNPGSTVLHARSVCIQLDGKIVIAGTIISLDNPDFAVGRYNADGSPDVSFGENGLVKTDFKDYFDEYSIFGSYDYSTSISIQPDGKIVVAGFTYDPINPFESGFNIGIVRYNPDGSLDVSFSEDGLILMHNEGARDGTVPLAIQPDGKIIVTKEMKNINATYDLGVFRFNVDGSLDDSFDADGIVTTNFDVSNSYEEAHALAIQPDGKIIAAGLVGGVENGFAIFRYNPNGNLDITFDDDGKVVSSFGPGSGINAIALSGNRIYAAGFDHPNLAILAAYSLINICSGNPGLEVTIPDAYAISPGGNINTVYIGYQPASSMTLTATPSGGNAPYNYNWSTVPSQSTQQITVSATIAGTYNYHVTVTDASGCTAQFSKTITAVNIISGQNLDKVYICHRDLKGKWTTLSVLQGSVANHLAHGDYLGPCNTNSSNSEILTRAANAKGGQEMIPKGFKIYPNPATHFLDVQWSTKNTSQTSIRILNAEGKTVKTITTQGAVNQQRITLNGLAKGVYILVLKTGSDQQVSKFVIQ